MTSEGIRFRMHEQKRERALLLRDGRPEHWLRRNVGGFVALAIGAATLGTTL